MDSRRCFEGPLFRKVARGSQWELALHSTPCSTNWLNAPKFSGVVCTLGVMTVDSGGDPHAYFERLGFSALQALDISDFEGADHIFDLNEDDLPEHLANRFDAVFNGGTLEHVFHVPNALASITRMLRPGGVVIHVVPCNGWVNHGFYQISPTLMFDYYEAAGFEPLESAMVSRRLDEPKNGPFVPSLPASPPTARRDRSTGVFISICSPRGEEKRSRIVPGRRNGFTPGRRRRAKAPVGSFPTLSRTARRGPPSGREPRWWIHGSKPAAAGHFRCPTWRTSRTRSGFPASRRLCFSRTIGGWGRRTRHTSTSASEV